MPQTRNREAQNQRRIAAPLPEALNRDLHHYAEAAKGASQAEASWLLSGVTVSAVGLGMLALTQLVHAEVVYTPANQSVNEQSRRLPIDFNHDGIADASLYVYGYCNVGSGFRGCFGTIFAEGLNGNAAMISGGGFASAAKAGKVIGGKGQFQDSPEMARGRSDSNVFNHTSFRSFKGPWADVQHRYLGFKFTIDGETHYGWARITTQGFPGVPSARLTGYAYETVANRPIVAGVVSAAKAAKMAPRNNGDEAAQGDGNHAALGMLAGGAPALGIWRREGDVR
jgi:hypothetical protein